MRVSTLPRMPCELEPEAERGELADPAGRARAEPAADRQLAEGQAVAGDDDVARVLARRDRGERDAVGGGGRQVLERVDGHVDPAVEQGVAQGADEDAGAAELGERRGAAVALGRDLDELDLAAEPARTRSATWPDCVVARAEARVPSRIAGRVLMACSSARVIRSTASGSRRNSSASAAV